MADRHQPASADTLRSLSVKRLQRGKLQPRRTIDGAALASLAKSIQTEGVLQPLFVRKVSPLRFEILAGERRWHAAKMAGLRRVPTVVREVSDATALAISLVENLHREDLNPIDQAIAIARLVREFSMTHAQVAETIGRSRATVSNLLRLLELPESVQTMLAEGRLDMGHARALLSLPREAQAPMAAAAVAEGLSVREVERRVQRQRCAPPAGDDAAGRAEPQLSWLREHVRSLGSGSSVERRRDGRWHLDIGFGSLEELGDALRTVERLLRDAGS